MKVFIAIAALLIAATPKGCAKDEDETKINLPDDTGYTAEDVRMRNSYADWIAFCREADSIIFAARIQISEASDCYDESRTPHRGRLKSGIIKAESRLEKLSNKMLQRREFSEKRFQVDESVLQEIEAFKNDFRKKQEALNESLLELKKLY